MSLRGDADAMLAGPWQSDAIAIRLARLHGRILIPPEIVAVAESVIRRFPGRPSRRALLAFLAEPTSVLDPRADVGTLCRLLDVDAGELAWFADLQGRGRRAPVSLQHYTWRTLPKRGGVRLVAAPKSRLKEIQRRLLRHAVAAIRLHDAAHGGVPGRSVATALAPHAGARALIRFDLESFFPTITAARIRGMFRALGMAEPVACTVAGLCTTAVPVPVWSAMPRPSDPARIDAHHRLGTLLRVPHTPQGAPTSPALANAIVFGLDRRLAGLASRFGARYTRYVDDLIFSGAGFLLTHRHRFVDAVHDVVRAEGFRIAERKTAVLTAGGRLSALGAVVNDHPTLARPERDRLRAVVHNCVVSGGASQARGRPEFRAELLGRIGAVGALDPGFAGRLRAQYDRIDWS